MAIGIGSSWNEDWSNNDCNKQNTLQDIYWQIMKLPRIEVIKEKGSNDFTDDIDNIECISISSLQSLFKENGIKL